MLGENRERGRDLYRSRERGKDWGRGNKGEGDYKINFHKYL